MPLCGLPPLLDLRDIPDPQPEDPANPRLSIFTATTPDRVQWATNSMEPIHHQRLKQKSQRPEHLLVCDGHSATLRGRCKDNDCRYVTLPNGSHHNFEATAHEMGIEHAIWR